MIGIRYDFETNDIVIRNDGSFDTAEISSQCCALIANSELCRLTKPALGASLPLRLENRNPRAVAAAISTAKRMVEEDGGKNVNISINTEGQLQYYAEYGDD